MKNLSPVKQFAELFEVSEEFQQGLGNYNRALKTAEWKFLKDLLLTMKGVMANDMFSRQHTTLDAQEKDVTQRTYFNMGQILDFLSAPDAWMKKQSKWKTLTDLRGKASKLNLQRKGGK